jgi:hypothetical protein
MPRPSPRILPSVASLRREQGQLLARIRARSTELQRALADVRRAGTEIAGRLVPLHVAIGAAAAEIHGLFDELLEAGRLGKRARPQVARLRRELVEEEVLPAPADGPLFSRGEQEPSPPPQQQDAASAPRAASGEARAVYRRLAGALHPDRAQDDGERARRTEAMKAITTAHGEGDLAALLELERRLAAVEKDEAALARENRELEAQLAALERELRAVRRSPQGAMARDVLAGRRRRGGGAFDDLVEQAEEELERLRGIAAHVRAFRDGKISLQDLLAGPEPGGEDALLEIAVLLEEAARELDRRPRRRKPLRGGAGSR